MQGRAMLVTSVLLAILTTATVTTVLLLIEPNLSKAEAIKTGGLAGGAVVALYALWLNDRRRRTEEAKLELEGDRVADERFARAVEMLGNEAAPVRVGALHALAALAESTNRYRQTVLDVLCAYLRQPTDGLAEPSREREVRRTAQRLITDLVPWGRNLDPRAYHLDLSGAELEHFRLEGRRVGWLTAGGARFTGVTRLGELRAGKPALFGGASFAGPVRLDNARLAGGISFKDAEFGGEVAWDGAEVGRFVDVRTAAPAAQTGALRLSKGTEVRGDPAGWHLTTSEPTEGRP